MLINLGHEHKISLIFAVPSDAVIVHLFQIQADPDTG
jgi:hypothetical protein